MNKSPIYDRIQSELDGRKKESRFRTVAEPGNRRPIDLATNSYLALHTCEEVTAEAKYLTDNCFAGNLASRLIETQTSLYAMLESELCEWEKTESALVFNSGYAANLGIIEALCTRDTDVFSDRLNHASIVDGIRLSGASLTRYGHCDMLDLKKRLAASSRKEKLIITDTVFSMDGDLAPLPDICDLARQFGCMVMVDEAHGTGVFGNRLCGCVEKFGLEESVDVKMGTLSKSFAGLGGFFAGSSLVRDFLVNTARSLIYSTALPQSVLAYDLAALRHIRTHPELGKNVLETSAKLRDAIRLQGFDTLKSESQIIPLVIGDEGEALRLSAFLAERGIKAPAIRPPTVPKGTSRIRFSVHAGLSPDNITHIIESLKEYGEKNFFHA
jgi:8-amino-7-oxononanoate synthase